MFDRIDFNSVIQALDRQAAVALLGPRQTGKTTLAFAISKTRPSLYLDLESQRDRNKLTDPELFFSQHPDELIILDEIHRAPEIFASLRGVIDKRRREGRRYGQFLILGSASIDLLKQSSESLAGRISYIELGPLHSLEVASEIDLNIIDRLWLRGGFPDSYLAQNDADSFQFRIDFIRTYLERDVAQFGPRIPSETLLRLWTMLAHNQGALLNASRLASGLSLSNTTTTTYINLLVDLLLLRRLPPYLTNTGKRLVKSPKTYIRDSGLLHALLNIDTSETLAGHPVIGLSWEGFIIENLLAVSPAMVEASFYRTAAGAEIDLVLKMGQELWAIEIKRSLSPKLTRGFYQALEDLQPTKTFIVYAGADRYSIDQNIEVIALQSLVEQLHTIF
jgi:predicted AAA+ superfamily ATPase